MAVGPVCAEISGINPLASTVEAEMDALLAELRWESDGRARESVGWTLGRGGTPAAFDGGRALPVGGTGTARGMIAMIVCAVDRVGMGRNWDPRANPVGVKQRVCAGIPVSIYLSQKKLGAQDGTQNWASKFQKEPTLRIY